MVLRGSQEVLFEQNDREDVLERYQLLVRALNEFDDKEVPYEISDGLQNS